MVKKKILLFTDWYEPGFKAGGPIQSCRNFVKAMQNDYELYVLTSDRDLGDVQPYEKISVEKWVSSNDGAQIYYEEEKKLTTSKILQLIREVNPDYIYLN